MGVIAPHPRIRLMFSCGQVMSEVWHSNFVSCQIVFVPLLVHCSRICSRLSVGALQWWHFSLCLRFFICHQNLPMWRELCVAWNRKACMGFLMSGFRINHQIIASVSGLDVIVWIAFLIVSRLFVVEFVCVVILASISAEYVSACVDVSSFIPSMLKLSGTDMFIMSGSSLQVPMFARWSACSFP